MHTDVKEVLFTNEQLQAKVQELGKQISADYKGEEVVLVCVLKGAVMFFADLARTVEGDVRLDFISCSSYGNSTVSSGVVRIMKDLDRPIEGKHVIIVEDIVDTGTTMNYLMDNLRSRKAKSIRLAALFDKPDRRKVEVTVDYSGFIIPDLFIVGYGLDYAEKYRSLNYVGVLKEEVYR